jgi:NDP-hexose-3-ketoreductase
MNSVKNIAVLGLGHHAIDKVIPAILRVKGLRLYAVCSRNVIVGEKVATQYGCKYIETEAELIADGILDIVYDCSPISLHYEHGVNALTSGKHFWSEKPICTSVDQAVNLLLLSRDKNLSLFEGLMYLHHPQFKLVKEQVADPTFGKILSFYSCLCFPRLSRPSFRLNKNLGGSSFLDAGCYPVSLALDLFNFMELEVEFTKVFLDHDFAADYAGYTVLTNSSGASIFLEWKMGSAYLNQLRILGENRSLFADKIFSKSKEFNASIELSSQSGAAGITSVGAQDHFELMLINFRKWLNDYEVIESERVKILHRAQLMERIWNSRLESIDN